MNKDNRLKIGVDIDGVLSNFIDSYRNICMGICGHTLPSESLDWNQTNWGLTKEQHKEAWETIAKTVSFYESLDLLPGVGSIVTANHTHRLFFVTTRPPTEGNPIEVQSAKWLKQRLGLWYPTVIVANNKGPVTKALELDYFIDDRPENLLDIHEHSPSTKLFVRSQAWNSDFKNPNVERVNTFDSFISRINGE